MRALIAYVIEFKYWSDISLLSYFWILLKPFTFYIAVYLLLSQSGYETNKSLLVSLEWSIYWFSGVSCVQSCKKLRKFVLYGGFRLSDFMRYAMLDFVFNFIVLTIPVTVLMGGILPLFSIEFLLFIILYFISIPIFIYIGILSVNAADFSYIFNFTPLILIGFISHDWLENSFVFSPYLAMAGKNYNLNYVIAMIIIITILSVIATLFLRNKFTALYSESIV